jgi:hypothetical protein
MKVLANIGAVVLSTVLALMPFALIAVNDSVAVKAEQSQGVT